MNKFILQPDGNVWTWKLNKDGRIIAEGGPYSTREKAKQSIRAVKLVAEHAAVDEQ